MTKTILKKLIKEGNSSWKISEILEVPQTTVRRYLTKYGLKTKFVANGKGESKKHLCEICGEKNPKKFHGNRKIKCGKCHNKEGMEKGRQQRKELLQILGGECLVCGFRKYETSLDCHHLDPSKKDPNFKGHRSWGKARLIKELENCILLCRNCHAAVHSGELKIRKAMIKKIKI